MSNSKKRTVTLTYADWIDNTLLITNFHTDKMSIRIFSHGLEYNEGIKKLKVNDDVLVATKESNFVRFEHYRVISLTEENNCKLIYSNKFYNCNNSKFPKYSYKLFIKEFKYRHDLH